MTSRKASSFIVVGLVLIATVLFDAHAVFAQQDTCFGRAITVDLNAGEQPTEGDDVILGTPGGDVINGLSGHDRICGGEGDDVINDGLGVGWVDGGPGNDVITTEFGDVDALGVLKHGKRLRGGGGDDIISGYGWMLGNRGNDTITGFGFLEGGDGDDTLLWIAQPEFSVAPQGSRTAKGGPGNDHVTIHPSASALQYTTNASGDDGDDVVVGGTQQWGGAGNDRLSGLFSIASISGYAAGGGGDDLIIGTEASELLYGDERSPSRLVPRERQGNDIIFGGGGDDRLTGGAGTDLLYGGTGNDVLFGNQGRDRLRGGAGDDDLRGGKGVDVLFGGGGTNACSSGNDKDRNCS